MEYTLERQIFDAEQDLLDDKDSLERAYKDVHESIEWSKKIEGWVAQSEQKLEKLKVELEANRIAKDVN